MNYLGGKRWLASPITAVLRSMIQPGQGYYEPFVGGGWVLAQMRAERRYAADLHPYLIAMWQALQSGWMPPDRVSRDEYNHIRDHRTEYPAHLVGFVGFACSYGGKWFGGYCDAKNYALQCKRALLNKIASMGDVSFRRADFLRDDPPEARMLIYCDPPYAGATEYRGVPKFDHDAFWARVIDLEQAGHTVLVSEYVAPDGFTCILEMPLRLSVGDSRQWRAEKLFRYGEHAPFQPRLL